MALKFGSFRTFHYLCKMRIRTKEQIKEWNRKYYLKNKEKIRERNNRQKTKVVIWYKELKKGLKCEECGFNHPAALSFHHKEGFKKEMGIADMIRMLCSIDRIKAEIEKCKVLCHNCHAIHHYGDNYNNAPLS